MRRPADVLAARRRLRPEVDVQAELRGGRARRGGGKRERQQQRRQQSVMQ
jgi:hypothetical protein